MSASQSWMTNHNAYLNFLGLKSNPFPLVPDTNHFFFSKKTNIILNELAHGINVRKGFLMLTGEVGLGKTTIVHLLLKQLAEEDIETALVFNTYDRDYGFIDKILTDFGINYGNEALSKKIDLLHDFLLEKNKKGKNCTIFIDDAQNLSLENIEIIRMISNLETSFQKLVQIILVGQPELQEKFELKEMRQLKSRIMINIEIQPLSPKELKDYLIYKSSCYQRRVVFSDDVFSLVHHLTKGNLRKINKLMDRCLYAEIATNSSIINHQVLMLAADELNFTSFFIHVYKYYKLVIFIASIGLTISALLVFIKGI